ncbi:MAG: hypothetical protein K8S16_08485, partial [Bacteroidales bacterium]|nr:hypothetical protein [Bacteroidales bacterium]
LFINRINIQNSIQKVKIYIVNKNKKSMRENRGQVKSVSNSIKKPLPGLGQRLNEYEFIC